MKLLGRHLRLRNVLITLALVSASAALWGWLAEVIAITWPVRLLVGQLIVFIAIAASAWRFPLWTNKEK